MKKLNKKKIIKIVDIFFTTLINIVILISIFTKEYGLGIMLILLQIYNEIINLDFKVKAKLVIDVPKESLPELKDVLEKIGKNK